MLTAPERLIPDVWHTVRKDAAILSSGYCSPKARGKIVLQSAPMRYAGVIPESEHERETGMLTKNRYHRGKPQVLRKRPPRLRQRQRFRLAVDTHESHAPSRSSIRYLARRYVLKTYPFWFEFGCVLVVFFLGRFCRMFD